MSENKYKYKYENGEVVEQPMEPPEVKNNDFFLVYGPIRKYEEHIKNLRRYPVPPEYRRVWKEGEDVTGRFKVKQINGLTKKYDTTEVYEQAIPIEPKLSHEDEMILAIRKTTARACKSPEAARKFLVDAGIIEPKQDQQVGEMLDELNFVHKVVRNRDFDLGFKTGWVTAKSSNTDHSLQDLKQMDLLNKAAHIKESGKSAEEILKENLGNDLFKELSESMIFPHPAGKFPITDLIYAALEAYRNQEMLHEGEIAYRLIKGDEVNSLLSVAMRTLTMEQKIALRDALKERTPKDNNRLQKAEGLFKQIDILFDRIRYKSHTNEYVIAQQVKEFLQSLTIQNFRKTFK